MGDRQRDVLARLAEFDSGWTDIHDLLDDPDDPDERQRVRAAVKALERRDYAMTMLMASDTRTTEAHYVINEGYLEPDYRRVLHTRPVVCTHVHLTVAGRAAAGRL